MEILSSYDPFWVERGRLTPDMYFKALLNYLEIILLNINNKNNKLALNSANNSPLLQAEVKEKGNLVMSKKIFIVHGHDDAFSR